MGIHGNNILTIHCGLQIGVASLYAKILMSMHFHYIRKRILLSRSLRQLEFLHIWKNYFFESTNRKHHSQATGFKVNKVTTRVNMTHVNSIFFHFPVINYS